MRPDIFLQPHLLATYSFPPPPLPHLSFHRYDSLAMLDKGIDILPPCSVEEGVTSPPPSPLYSLAPLFFSVWCSTSPHSGRGGDGRKRPSSLLSLPPSLLPPQPPGPGLFPSAWLCNARLSHGTSCTGDPPQHSCHQLQTHTATATQQHSGFPALRLFTNSSLGFYWLFGITLAVAWAVCSISRLFYSGLEAR